MAGITNGIIPISGISFLLLCVFGIMVVGYALGRITIKGVSLGDAGVFIVALLFGAFAFGFIENDLVIKDAAEKVIANYSDKALALIEKLGLMLFVTAVGFIAGPKFFGNFKKNFKSYVLLGVIIILAGGLATIGCIYFGRLVCGEKNYAEFTALLVGIMSGSLTSTPAYAASTETAAAYKDAVTVGHAIAYIFGVLGVVLFVQIVPKLMKANMEEERKKLVVTADAEKPAYKGKLFHIDGHGLAVFSLAAVLGTVVGSLGIPLSIIGLKGAFSLTTTGGCLLVSLILGHFSRIGKISLMPDKHTLQLFRELGLVLFLVGAGIPGGAEFANMFKSDEMSVATIFIYLGYGVVITVVPMIVGFFFAKFVLKLSLLNNLGSLTGGMTSTPALGTLIGVSGTDDVANAYAATYPVALISVVLASQIIILLFS